MSLVSFNCTTEIIIERIKINTAIVQEYPIFKDEKVGWLTDGKIALGSMAIVTIWRWAGYYMVMVVAGRLEISQEFFEAADLDGANALKKLLITP